ncbi:hypothetical protein [Kitasatospora indigofera]|nr:hypothetical protein [Kitasatospora indigofera]
MVGLASAAALTTGPLTALAAAIGTAATSAIATRTARKAATRLAQRGNHTTARGAGQRGGGHLSLVKPTRTAGGGSAGGVPRQNRSGAVPGGSARPAGHRPSPVLARPGVDPAKPNRPGTDRAKTNRPGADRIGATTGLSSPRRLAEKAGGVRALRKAERAAAPSRAERRERQTTARRQVADARRAVKAAERAARLDGRGRVGKVLAKPGQAARRSLDKARDKGRAGAEKRLESKVRDARSEARKAPARRHARRQLAKSAARHHGRRLLAAALALPVGLLGMVLTPIGRKLGLSWLMYPGRRLYRHLSGRSADARTVRDTEIREQLADAEAAADQPADTAAPVGEAVPRAPKNHHANTNLDALGGDVTNPADAGFNFSEVASEMYGAAMNYDPDGMMHVLTAIESMPEGLTSIANTFRVLAERSDDEFPLEKVVGESLNEVYTLLMQAVSAAEEVGKAFRNAHEGDIARHDDPRTGEEKWDIGNNQ